MLENLFGNPVIEKILFYLLIHNEGYSYQLSKTLDTPLFSIQKAIQRLEAGGVLISLYKGKTRVFQFNPRYPLLDELQKFLKAAYQFLPEEYKACYYERPKRKKKSLPEWDKISFVDFAAFLSSALLKQGIRTTLVGPACFSIYTNDPSPSPKLHLITFEGMKGVSETFKNLGFKIKGRSFKRDDCRWSVEFASPPVSVGHEKVEKFEYLKTPLGTIQMLTALDCVKDRLINFFHWDDNEGITQAGEICNTNSIDLKEVEIWSKNEGFHDKFKEFVNNSF